MADPNSNPFCNITYLYSQLVLTHLTQYNRKPRTKQICQIISFSSNLNAPTNKNQKQTQTNKHTWYIWHTCIGTWRKKKPLTTGKQATRYYLMTKLSNIPITRHKTQLYM